MFPIIFLCNTLNIALGVLVQHYVAATVVQMQRPRLFIWSTSFVTTVLWSLNNYLLPSGSSALDILNCSISVFSTVLFSPRGRKWQGAVTMIGILAVQIAVGFTVSLFAFPIAQKLGYSPADLVNKTTSFGNAVMSLICLCLITPLYFLFGKLMTRLFQGNKLSPMVLCFLPIPISQAILMNILNRVLPLVNGVDGIETAYTLAVLLAIAADVGFLVGVQKIQQAKQLREQMRIVNQQLNVQTEYYRQLQDSILSVNQIRHDLNNQLQAAYHLMESGETALVRRQLDQVQNSICQRVGPRFSSNLIVDAVLQDKDRCCREQGMLLSVNAELPSELPIENAHLCSVFSNLLDNSIHGALESGAQKKEISLQAAVRNNCLVIHCDNPAIRPNRIQSRDLLRSHGLGLEILGRIASLYHGSLNTDYREGRFHASLCLPLSKASEGEPANAQ